LAVAVAVAVVSGFHKLSKNLGATCIS
jgi:hypothetical protein